MNKNVKAAALIAAISVTAIGCQKDYFEEPVGVVNAEMCVRTVTYSVDGVKNTMSLRGEQAWADFLNRMLGLAREGHHVSFRCSTQSATCTGGIKEMVTTTTTTDQDEAYQWAEKMADKGYEVEIEYDMKTGTYTCTATR